MDNTLRVVLAVAVFILSFGNLVFSYASDKPSPWRSAFRFTLGALMIFAAMEISARYLNSAVWGP